MGTRDQGDVSASGVLSVSQVATRDTTQVSAAGVLSVTTIAAPDVDRTSSDGFTLTVGYSFTNAEAEALVARFTTEPDDARKLLIDNMVGALKSAGVWAKLDALYLMAAADAQAAQRNWIADLFNLSEVSAPAFVADRGYTGDGVASYVDTGLTPSTGGTKLVLNSMVFGLWSRSAGQQTAPSGITAGGSQITVLPRSATDTFNVRANSATATTAANADGIGLYAVNRSGASALELYKNGAQAASAATASLGLPTTSVAFGGNHLAAFNTIQIAGGFLGQSLSGADHAALYSAMLVYMQATGSA